MKSDIEIAQAAKLQPIIEIASKLNLTQENIEPYGNYIAKIAGKDTPKKGKLVLVTSINPTPSGEGKSTVTVGLVDGLASVGQNVMACLREPSLGPVFGLKGGACGGGYSQVVPMENINLHFTGDMHAITTSNNLISACIDSHIFHGNELNFDLEKILFKRVLDMNDRNLRQIKIGMGSKFNGIERMDGFDITVASEIMAILCLSNDIEDFGNRIDKIILGLNKQGNPIYLKQLNITGSIKVLMKEALKPNLVQTLEGTPCLIHGGPFANIAHGCNSLIATKTALSLSDIVVTEAGFGADLGFEKFIDIKCRIGNLKPDCVVIVATIKALKLHGGVEVSDLAQENIEALKIGIANLEHHIKTIKKSGLNFVVALNKFPTDTDQEINTLIAQLDGIDVAVSSAFLDGGVGARDLANKVVNKLNEESNLNYFYDLNLDPLAKLDKIIKEVYGGDGYSLSDQAKIDLELIKRLDTANLPICIAKTPNSLSGDPKLINVPTSFTLEVKRMIPRLGAGFIIIQIGNVMTMPGLGKVPNATKVNISSKGDIIGLS